MDGRTEEGDDDNTQCRAIDHFDYIFFSRFDLIERYTDCK